MPVRGGKGGSRADQILALALENVRDPRVRVYVEELSGRTVFLDPARIPYLEGRSTGSYCILAYYSGGWHPVVFVPFKSMVRAGKTVVFGVTDRLTRDSKLLIDLPSYTPKFVDPRVLVPAPARGARRWFWLNLSVGGYSYPLLVVMDGPQIGGMCGHIPFVAYDEARLVQGTIIMGDPPYPVLYALKHGIRMDTETVIGLHKPPATLNVTVSPLYTHPLPDGGGGGGEIPGPAKSISWAGPVLVPETVNGVHVWKPLEYNITGGNHYGTIEFDLYPSSPSVGVHLSDIYLKTITLTITMSPAPTKDFDLQILDANIVVESEGPDEYNGTGSVELASWSLHGESHAGYGTVFLNMTEGRPYGIHTDRLHVRIEYSYAGNTSARLSFLVGYNMRVLNFTNYIPDGFIANSSYGVLSQSVYDPGRPLLTLVVPAGSQESDPNTSVIPVAAPNGVAVLQEESFRYSRLPLRILIPPGFPGGALSIIGIPGVYGFTVGIPSNPTDKTVIYDTSVNLTTSWNRGEILGIISKPLHLVYAYLVLGSAADRLYTVKVYIPATGTSSAYIPFTLRELPILPYEHPEAGMPGYNRALLPVAGVDFVFNSDGYIAGRPVLRQRLLYNYMYRYSNKYRYAYLDTRLYFTRDNIVFTLNLQPRTMEYYTGGETILGAGRITGFNAIIDVNYYGSDYDCNNGSIGFVARGVSSGGHVPGSLGRFMGVLSKVSAFSSMFSRLASEVADSISLIDFIIKTKSIVNIGVTGACNGPHQTYYIQGSNTGWAPNSFENAIMIILPNAYQPGTTGCANARIGSVTVTTSDSLQASTPAPGEWTTVCEWGLQDNPWNTSGTP
ncbi:MAG: hypothetical protein LRS48_04405 [Desulfurococcales archaeon]|nr:hypothetical protein [Desulfurococcales archaeon]